MSTKVTKVFSMAVSVYQLIAIGCEEEGRGAGVLSAQHTIQQSQGGTNTTKLFLSDVDPFHTLKGF